MERQLSKIGLGGGCHWCTEAVFLSLKGVAQVEQGFIALKEDIDSYSEAIIIHYNSEIIGLEELIQIHLYTHNSTADHSMRSKYRSGVYVFDSLEFKKIAAILKRLQADFSQSLVTKAYLFGAFKPSLPQFHNYYYSNPDKPFCNTYIAPKLALLLKKFKSNLDLDKFNRSHGFPLEN